jgi:tRNA threonylcarbamoyladenosine biosynthesis protein TsaB
LTILPLELLVPVFDARRQAVYAGIFQWQNGQLVTILEDQFYSIFPNINKWLV